MLSKKTKNQKQEWEQKIIDIRRVARVVAGGKRFNFRVSVIIGNRRGEVGFGMGKGSDTAMAIDKALRDAKKNLITVPLNKHFSIPDETKAKFSSSIVYLSPAKEGHGLVAGGAVRTVLDLAGVKNAIAKILSRSKNKINIAKATIRALRKLK